MRALVVTVIVGLAALAALWYFDVLQIDIANPFVQKTAAVPAPPRDLFEVATSGTPDQVAVALAAGARIGATDRYGQTPLMYAAGQHADPQMVAALIKAGAEVNAQSEAGWTALMYAVRDNENPEVVLTLLNAGADPTLVNGEGQIALDLAAENGPFRRSSAFVVLENLKGEAFDPAWPSGFVAPVEGATFSGRPSHLPGSRRAYRNGYHEGFDFYNGTVRVPIAYGTPVVATAAGTVIRAEHDYVEMTEDEYNDLMEEAANLPATPRETLDKLRGRQVWIEHPGGYISRYAHLSDIPESITVGTQVAQGQLVGFAGNSGTIEGVLGTQDDPHPHYELWRGEETYVGEGLGPDQIYVLVDQIFGDRSLPLFRE